MNKFDLKDITFIIPFKFDGEFRLENLKSVLFYLTSNFNTNILITEVGEVSALSKNDLDLAVMFDNNLQSMFYETHDNIFYRTKITNNAVKQIKTPYFAIHDADVILPIENYIKASELLKKGFSYVRPYNGKFINISDSYNKDKIIVPIVTMSEDSMGGVQFLNKTDYILAGMQNEKIISWGFEDWELYERMKILGFSAVSNDYMINQPLYHIDHPRDENGRPEHQFYENNKLEYEKVKSKSQAEMLEYIRTFPWK